MSRTVVKTVLALLALLLVTLSVWSENRTRPRAAREGGAHEGRVAPVLRGVLEWRQDPRLPVIVRVRRDVFRNDLEDRLHDGRNRDNMLLSAQAYQAHLRPSEIRMLLDTDWVEYVTLDPVVRSTVSPTEKKRRGKEKASLRDYGKIIGSDQTKGTGRGIGIAVLDSGVQEHKDLPKAKVKVDFSRGEQRGGEKGEPDRYGHGTHVAGIIAGDGGDSGGSHHGVSSKSDLIDVQVINEEGWGVTSNLIKAIDWVIENHEKYDIRVVNLSLGHPPLESYRDDPLCAAVRRMVEAGVVAVVSAGNLGKTAEYPVIYGGITSPGIEPSAITVGAINNRGTLTHDDDIGTTFSSRGPTIDGLFKPDLSAPGNAIPAAVAAGSYLEQHLADQLTDGSYLELSGSSMATAFVSGTVAQMLERNEDLNPHLVKTILMLTATKLRQPHLFEQGNGMVNAKAAVEMAKNIDVKKRELKKDIDPYWLLALEEDVKCKKKKETEGCERVWVGGALAYADQVLFSPLVASPSLDLWGSDVAWSASLSWEEKSKSSWAGGFFDSESHIWDSSMFWTDAFVWSDLSMQSSGILGVDAFLWSDSMFWTDGFYWSDSLLPASSEDVTADHFRGDP